MFLNSMHGIGTAFEWSIEGKRLVSLTPRLVPQTVFTAKATHTANALSLENSKLPAKKGNPCNLKGDLKQNLLLMQMNGTIE